MIETPHKTLLALTALLAIAVLLGCRPADSPRRTSTTHAPAVESPLANSTLPKAGAAELPVEAPAEAAPAETASSESDAPAPPETLEAAPDSDTGQAETSAAEPTLVAFTERPSDPVERARPIPKPQPGKTLDLTFDDIKFDIQPDEPFERQMLPQEIEDLHGQKIRIGGYMLPSFQNRDIKQFVLVRDNMECCFGPGAALYDCILVEMTGAGIDFTVRPITVEGVFTISEYKGDDGKHLAIYHLDGLGAN